MSQANSNNRTAVNNGSGPWARNLAIWAGCAFLWFVLDRVTKAYFDGFSVGQVVGLNLQGVLQFSLVHNVGVAWGALAGQVPVISIVTAFMCVAIAVFAVYWARSAGKLEMLALGLLFAGGIGNLFDRVAYGYVVDFITPLFISFPTFNVADIGVTCGIALLAIVWVVQIVRESMANKADSATGEAGTLVGHTAAEQNATPSEADFSASNSAPDLLSDTSSSNSSDAKPAAAFAPQANKEPNEDLNKGRE